MALENKGRVRDSRSRKTGGREQGSPSRVNGAGRGGFGQGREKKKPKRGAGCRDGDRPMIIDLAGMNLSKKGENQQVAALKKGTNRNDRRQRTPS